MRIHRDHVNIWPMISAKKIWLLILNGRVCCEVWTKSTTERVTFAVWRITVPESWSSRWQKFFRDTLYSVEFNAIMTIRIEYFSLSQELSISNSKCEISWTINITGVLGLTFFHTSLFCYRLTSCTRRDNLSFETRNGVRYTYVWFSFTMI